MPEHHSPIMLSQVQMKKALVYCCGIVYTVTHKTSLLSVILLVVGTNSIYHFQVCCLVLLCIFTVLLIYSNRIKNFVERCEGFMVEETSEWKKYIERAKEMK